MNKNLKIVLMIIAGFVLSLVYYRMFFSNFDKNNLVEYNVVLIQNPEYHSGAVHGSPSWWFKSKNQTFELNNYNPVNISEQEIRQLEKGDSLTIYNYQYFSIPSFLGKLNDRIIVHGIKAEKLKKYYPHLIKKHIRELDVQVFWGINFFTLLIGFTIYSDNLKKKNNTTNRERLFTNH